jgi:hypothetical protein
MVTVILPATNHKPSWVEILVDGSYAGRIWAHSAEVTVKDTFKMFQVRLCGELGSSDAFIWADAIQQAKE